MRSTTVCHASAVIAVAHATRHGRGRNVLAVFASVIAFVLSVWSSVLVAEPAITAVGHEPLIVGLSTHIDRKGTDYLRALRLAKEAGADSIRFDATWASVEQKEGVLEVPARLDDIVDAANREHMKVLLILGYGNRWYEHGAKPSTPSTINAFTRYVDVLASHFKGGVYAYEVWDEWDDTAGNTQPGTATGYLRLLSAVYPVLKRADPGALVLGGSLTSRAIQNGYLTKLIQLGALRYMDGLALHPYVQCAGRGSTVVAWKSWLGTVEQQLTGVAHHPVPMYLTEIGWPSSVGQCGVSPEVQAARAHDVVIAADALGFVRGVWWYDLLDDGASPTDAEDQFGLINANGSPKPAFAAFKSAVEAVKARAPDR